MLYDGVELPTPVVWSAAGVQELLQVFVEVIGANCEFVRVVSFQSMSFLDNGGQTNHLSNVPHGLLLGFFEVLLLGLLLPSLGLQVE